MTGEQNQGRPNSANGSSIADGNEATAGTAAVAAQQGGNADAEQQKREQEVYRGSLLQLSHFLNTFQRFYSLSSEEEKELNNVITPQDIENALTYRFLLQMEAELLDRKCSLEADQLMVKINEDDDDDDETLEGVVEVDTIKRQQLEDELLEIEHNLAERPKRDYQVHLLLQRFEVWSTKEMAHSVLMPDCGCKTIDDATLLCWSKLLHVPGAAYFSDRWPSLSLEEEPSQCDSDKENADQAKSQQQQQTKPNRSKQTLQTEFSKMYHRAYVGQRGHSFCSLVLPPNCHTWEFYARIAQMVSLLPTKKARKDAADSPCSGVLKTIHQTLHPNVPFPANEKSVYTAEYVFKPHDMVALWVRSQHSTVALRHLFQIYSWLPQDKIEAELAKKQGRSKIVTTEDSNNNDKSAYGVLFRGNRKSTRRRVLGETKLVESLIEWAVMNQVLITYDFMKRELEAKETQENKKRSRNESDFNPRPTKRTRRNIGEEFTDADELPCDYGEELLRACWVYILRWFARRNHPMVAILYVSQASPPPSAASLFYTEESLSFLEECKEADIPGAIHQHMKEHANKHKGVASSDRSFARIGRRVRKGKYDEKDCDAGCKSPFYTVMDGLLGAWRECVAKKGTINIDVSLLTAVIDDFNKVYEDFCYMKRSNGLLAAAKSLLDLSSHEDKDPEELRDLLLAAPAPWNDLCSECMRVWKKHQPQSSSYTVCSNCEKAFQENCCPESTFRFLGIDELLKTSAMDILQLKMFPVQLPPDSDLNPDYRGQNASRIEWTTEVLTVTRENCEDWGMTLRQTDASRTVVDELIAGNITIDYLYGDVIIEDYPFALESELDGSLVTSLKPGENLGRRSGFKPSDVIVGLELISMADDHELSQDGTRYNLRDLNKSQRLELFKLPSSKVKVTVKRPNISLIEQSAEWIGRLREHNSAAKALYEKRLPFCKSCQKTQEAQEGDIIGASILEEARYCRAVIRRLGMETYSKQFHNEELLACHGAVGANDLRTVHSMCVSLARLDAMMEYIILSSKEELTQVKQLASATDKDLLHKAFYLPAWISPKQERLAWAPESVEKTPAVLLCRGIRHLLETPIRAYTQNGLLPNVEDSKKNFHRHFIHLFSSWYLAPMQKCTLGPPPAALYYRRPWIAQNCDACHVRPGTIRRDDHRVCDKAACRRVLRCHLGMSGPGTDGFGSSQSFHFEKVSFYERNAKLVGTTILIFPGDPLLYDVAHRIRFSPQQITHICKGPVEFICACFIPPLSDNSDGEFLLLPVFMERQLQFLVDRCQQMDPPSNLMEEPIHDWISKSILGLEGVLHLSCKELRERLHETYLFLDRVGADIASNARGSVETADDFREIEVNTLPAPPMSTNVEIPASHKKAIFLNHSAEKCSRLLDFLLRAPSPALRLMIEATDDSRDFSNSFSVDVPGQQCLDENEVDNAIWVRPGFSMVNQPSEKERVSATEKDDKDWEPETFAGKPVTEPLSRANFNLPQQRGDFLAVIYSDLYFGSGQEMLELRKSLSPLKLSSPVGRPTSGIERKIIVLSRAKDTPAESEGSVEAEYTGVGWGFELFKWKGERCLRVGRIHPNSPAAVAGFKTDDIIMSINGRSVARGTEWPLSFLFCAILGSPAPNTYVRKTNVLNMLAIILTEIGSKGAVRGPVVFEVDRPQFQVITAGDSRVLLGQTEFSQTPRNEQNLNAYATHHKAAMGVDRGRDTGHSGMPQLPQAEDLQTPRHEQNLDAAPSHPETVTGFASSHGTGYVRFRQQGYPQAAVANVDVSIAPREQNDTDDEVVVLGATRQQHTSSASVARACPETDEPNETRFNLNVQCLRTAIAMTLEARRNVSSEDLYVAAGCGTVLTKIEAAVYLEAVQRNMPKLGLRLLSPRYRYNLLRDQVVSLTAAGSHLRDIPRISNPCYSEILRADYKRVRKEPGNAPKFFVDDAGSYAYPSEILPLDRFVEMFMRRIAVERQTSNVADASRNGGYAATSRTEPQQPHPPYAEAMQMMNPTQVGPPVRNNLWPTGQLYPQQTTLQPPNQSQNYGEHGQVTYFQNQQEPNNPAERIRGGGESEPEDAEEESEPSLIDLHVSEWQGQPVYTEADTVQEGEARGIQLFMGYVRPLPEEDLAKEAEEIEEVPVALIYSNRVGAFAEALVKGIDPYDLKLVPENSKLAETAARVIAQYNPMKRFKEPELCRRKISGEIQIQQQEPVAHSRQQQSPDLVDNAIVQEETGAAPESVGLPSGETKGSPVASENREHSAAAAGHSPHDSMGLGQAAVSSNAINRQANSPRSEATEEPLSSKQPNPLNTGADATYLLDSGGNNQSQAVDLQASLNSPAAQSNGAQDKTSQVSSSFIRTICKQLRGALKPLGHLPDGRDVLWIPSDPEALYIEDCGYEPISHAAAEKSFQECVVQQQSQRRSHLHSSSSRCCVYGCTYYSTGAWVEFDTEAQLICHNKNFHSLGLSSERASCFGELGRFVRVPKDDDAMKKLIAGLTSAAASRSTLLMSDLYAVKSRPTVHFDPSTGQSILCSPTPHHLELKTAPVLHMLSKFEAWSKKKNVFDLASEVDPTSQVVYLLSRIMLLFNIHEGASFRHSSTNIKQLFTPEVTSNSGRNEGLKWMSPCCCSSSATHFNKEGLPHRCPLCSLECEEVLQVDGDNEGNVPTFCGVGCGVAGDMLFPQYRVSSSAIAAQGDLGFVKELLLGLAKKIPTALRLEDEGMVSQATLGPLRKKMWGHRGSKAYQRHVLRSKSVSMLSQAFVVLLASIKREKLPLWWRAEENGWCKPQRLLLFPSKSSLVLNIMLFDVALAEFTEIEPENVPLKTLSFSVHDIVPDDFNAMGVEERLDELLRCAEQASVHRYKGEHEDFCCICEDGGNGSDLLVCCEFCPRIVHQGCLNPPLVELPKHWVCAACTVDILELAKS